MHIRITKTQILFLIFLIRPFIYPSPNKTITNSFRWDGFGSQFLAIIGSVIDAERNNCIFEYTPFTKMEHNYDDDSKFLEKKEWLINFLDNFDQAKPNTPFAECNYHHMENGGKFISPTNGI